LSKVELESFLKSFFLFFTSLSILIGTLFYLSYKSDIQTLNEKILSQMRVCSYDLKCDNFELDFIDKENKELYKLYKSSSGLKSYFPIPKSEKFVMSLEFSNQNYLKKLKTLKNKALRNFALVIFIVIIISLLFSFYALSPLRNALFLTQEFIKDILHDFNTPLASLRLNTSMLKKEIGENGKIERIEASVTNVLTLQEHLRSYLNNHSFQKEEFYLDEILKQQIELLQKNYPNITFSTNVKNIKITTNKEAFMRIIDNILTNAAKYNKVDGKVIISFENNKLQIEDTGKGIKNPRRIFERFYKEQTRGIGIGLHIVSKLCDELKINISVKSQVGVGSSFILNLSKVIFE
jgi:two-component system, OmpR family, sensor kinase